jgi:hypothetical protein
MSDEGFDADVLAGKGDALCVGGAEGEALLLVIILESAMMEERHLVERGRETAKDLEFAQVA